MPIINSMLGIDALFGEPVSFVTVVAAEVFSFVNSWYLWLAIGSASLFVVVLLLWVRDLRNATRAEEQAEQVRYNEAQLREIFKRLPDPVFIESEAGVVLDVNPQACAMQGMSYGELVGSDVLNLVPDEQRATVKKFFPKWFTGELNRYEGQLKRGDGTVVDVELIGAPMEYDGQTAMLLQVRDISDRKRAETALKKSEARYRSLIEVQSSLIVRLDAAGRFTYVNEALCRFLGKKRGELVGERLFPIVCEEDIPVIQEALAGLFGGSEEIVVRNVRAPLSGQIVWVKWEAMAIFDETGRVTEVQAVGRDITESRRMHRALQESEKRLRFLFEEIPHIAVAGCGIGREVFFWNRASERLYGYTREEAIGRKLDDLVIVPEQRDEFVAAMARWVDSGELPPAGEVLKHRSDGERVVVHSTRLSTENADGEREMYVVDVNLSELKRAHRELVEAKQSAERANRAKSEFLANMSHEIRTPMNGVMGMTNLLLESELTEEQRQFAQMAQDSTKDLLGIIDELLDISRVEAGDLRLQLELFRPRELVERVTALFSDRALGKGVVLSVAVHPDVPAEMKGDAGRIRQVIINLMENALKFTDEGHIQIRMQAAPLDGGWDLKVDVQDTGIGMEPELLDHIFEKFMQGDSSSHRQYGGVGLGLAICKQLVGLMGGEISVSSVVGQGSMFMFNVVLPAVDKPVTAVAAPAAGSGVSIGADVLVVEDNLLNQKVTCAILDKAGCRTCVAINGQEALAMLPETSFDLIVMDIQMPVMDGYEATRAIREMDGDIRSIPIIALTAHALEGDREKCLDAGMDDYLTKPVSKSKLIAMVKKYCG